MVHRLCVGGFAFKDYHFDPAKIFLRKDSLSRARVECFYILFLYIVVRKQSDFLRFHFRLFPNWMQNKSKLNKNTI